MNRAATIGWFCLAAAWIAPPAGSARAQDGEMVWDGTQWIPASKGEPGTAGGDLTVIREMVPHEGYRKVIEKAEAFLVNYPDSPACEEAMNLAGQSLLNHGYYYKAWSDWFEPQISRFPNGAFFERALDREYLIADAYLSGRKQRKWKILRLPAKDLGVDILLRVASHAPGTEIAERALLRVADFHFAEQAWDDAIGAYDQFVTANPRSDRRPYAMLQAAKASLLAFKGVSWDESPLLNAAERYRVFVEAYPRLAGNENIPRILQEIRLTQAHKVFETGQFYERTKHPTAAVFYYRKMLQDFPDTSWAQAARERLEVIGPVAPVPPEQIVTPLRTNPPESAGTFADTPASPSGRDWSGKIDQAGQPVRLEDLDKLKQDKPTPAK
jgi:outer membrane protein assembly factor BamD (BamD/ComL family)